MRSTLLLLLLLLLLSLLLPLLLTVTCRCGSVSCGTVLSPPSLPVL
jgi:hypothetical protein